MQGLSHQSHARIEEYSLDILPGKPLDTDRSLKFKFWNRAIREIV